EANDVLLLGNMSLLRNRLSRMGSTEALLASPRFVEETAMGYRKLGLAVLDDNRRLLAASEGFAIPVDRLPEHAIPMEALPARIDNAAEKELRSRFGGLSREWTAPGGRWYQVPLAPLALPPAPHRHPP